VNFEDQLRDVLKREPAPADFTAKVLARTSAERSGTIWRRPAILALAASLTLAALIPAAIEYRQRQRAREAKQQLIAALIITRTQLDQVKERIHQTHIHQQ
jgi:hypothetical protein